MLRVRFKTLAFENNVKVHNFKCFALTDKLFIVALLSRLLAVLRLTIRGLSLFFASKVKEQKINHEIISSIEASE